jgi:hypothetical protein
MPSTEGTRHPLVMISAMYENGGNTTHRYLDGHPELLVYPFESQLGTASVRDRWSALYPVKYRWPVFRLGADLATQFESIIDEECRVRVRTPFVSKFRDHPFGLDDGDRKRRFIAMLDGTQPSPGDLVAAFFAATFDAWTDLRRSGLERLTVGYSPIFGVDAERFLEEMPGSHVLHVVRNPWSAYAETKRRPAPLSLAHYIEGWVVLQTLVLAASRRFADRITVLRFEDLCHDPGAALRPVCERIGIDAGALVLAPTWNGTPLTEVYPWGTIRRPTTEENERTAAELTPDEAAEVARRAHPLLDAFAYTDVGATRRAAAG